MVSWWPGDGDADDIVGANRVMMNRARFTSAGKVGGAFELDGDLGRVAV